MEPPWEDDITKFTVSDEVTSGLLFIKRPVVRGAISKLGIIIIRNRVRVSIAQRQTPTQFFLVSTYFPPGHFSNNMSLAFNYIISRFPTGCRE